MLRRRLQSETDDHKATSRELDGLRASFRDLQASHTQVKADHQNLSVSHSKLTDAILDLRSNLRGKEEQIENLNSRLAAKDNEILKCREENRRSVADAEEMARVLKATESRVVELEQNVLEKIATAPTVSASSEDMAFLRSERQRAIDIAAYQRDRFRESDAKVKDLEEDLRRDWSSLRWH